MAEISKFAKQRMDRHGLTEDHVSFIVSHNSQTYTAHGDEIYVATLPDGRIGKVRVGNNLIMDAFTFAHKGD